MGCMCGKKQKQDPSNLGFLKVLQFLSLILLQPLTISLGFHPCMGIANSPIFFFFFFFLLKLTQDGFCHLQL